MYDSILYVGNFNRVGVLILGDYPIDSIPFTERNLMVKTLPFNQTKEAFDILNDLKAIIYSAHPGKYGLVKKNYEMLFEIAENYGITQKILVHSEKDMNEFKKIFGNELILKHFHYYTQIKEIAEQIARYSPGPPEATNLKIEGNISSLDDEAKLLLCRSFYDCTKIHVELITGGKDANYLLKVYAWLGNSVVSASMLPFFVKISSPDKIDQELANYRVYTDLYISFQYRPNCRIERCVRTRKYKSLVGNFVDDAISLRKALEDNYHIGIIHSLFEKSLRGFRRQSKTPLSASLSNFVKGRIKIDQLLKRNDVITKATEFGLKSYVLELHNRLLSFCTESFNEAAIHGDLHSGNVMVSGHDAILIDFSAIKCSGPATADPATLEVSLCFNLGEKPAPQFENWKSLIDEVYHPKQILKPLAYTDQIPDEFSWLRRAIREIRHILIGCDCCKSEIEIIIVCYLMRIARLTPTLLKDDKDEFEFKCHAYALVVAETIIDSLTMGIK